MGREHVGLRDRREVDVDADAADAGVRQQGHVRGGAGQRPERVDLLDLGAAALVTDPQLNRFSGYVQDSGEGRWTVEAAIEEAVPADVLSTALYARFRSRQEHNFGEKMLSAMRFGFGGHIEGNESIDPKPKPKPKEPQVHPAAQNAAE